MERAPQRKTEPRPMTQPEPQNKPAPALDPELTPLAASFERGDFAALGDQLERLPETAAKKPEASPLRAAVTVDGAHVAVIALCTLALIAIVLRYIN
jgi:hypothetical protein